MIRRTLVLAATLLALSGCSLIEDALLDAVLGDDASLGVISSALVGDDGSATGSGSLAATPPTDPTGTAGLLGRVDDEGSARTSLPAGLPTDTAIDTLLTDEDRALLEGPSERALPSAQRAASGALTYGAFYAYAVIDDETEVTFPLRRDLLADLLLTRLVLRGDGLEAALGERVAVDLLLAASVTLFDGAPDGVDADENADLDTVADLADAIAAAQAAERLVSAYDRTTFVLPMVGLCRDDVCVLRANLPSGDEAVSATLRVLSTQLSAIERIFDGGAANNGVLLAGRFALDAALPAATEFEVLWGLSDLRVAAR